MERALCFLGEIEKTFVGIYLLLDCEFNQDLTFVLEKWELLNLTANHKFLLKLQILLYHNGLAVFHFKVNNILVCIQS